MPRIFVSHAGRDRAWAEWARWHLEAAGFETELDSVDWSPGDNFMEAMHRALNRDNPMLILLSSAYLELDRYTADEWTARLAQRRKDSNAKLIPFRIDDVDLHEGLWAPIFVPDLFGLSSERAVEIMLDGVQKVARSPAAAPVAAGAPPYPVAAGSLPYPGAPAPAVATDPRPPGSLPAVWNLARRNPAFTGRVSMLNRLHDTLGDDRRAAIQALYGLGGVGKTQLALEYAHRFAGEYDLVWWVPSEQPELIGDHLATLAADMGLVPVGSATPNAVKQLHSRLRGSARWLLIFDNAEKREDLAPWLPDGRGHLIITSRSPAWAGVAEPLDVDVFSRAESVALLRIRLPHLADADAVRLAEALGDLPLAIGQAADLLAETRISVDHYLAELGEHAAELLRDGQPPAGYPTSLGAAVTFAAGRLAGDDPVAAQLLALCARLGAGPIPADLFTAHPELLPQPLAGVAGRPVALARTVAQLGRYGLARVTEGGPSLHRLTQAILRDADPDAAGHQRTVEQLLVAAEPDDGTSPIWWSRWGKLLPHILACDPTTTENSHLRSTTIYAVWHLIARGDARAALPLAEQLHAAWTRRLGSDDPIIYDISNALAYAYSQLGHYQQARRIDEDTLTRRRRVRGDDDPMTLISANDLANDLRMLGEVERARELHEDTLARRRRVLGDEHPATLSSANQLAIDLRMLGEYERARELGEDTLSRRRRVLGDDDPHTLVSVNNLAIDLRLLGEVERARELHEDTLARRRRVLGDEHPHTLSSAWSLAVDLRLLGEVERARELHEDTLVRRRRVLGDDHPDTLNSVDHLAEIFDEVGEHAEAERLRREFG
ncbi:FxSxx-COOH system tetratricopeptide repeat protein [Actinoplanes sp. NPDC026619]|uniref:FxSxx-COOH system tetratricopeptide repeat protein n=1 Tax=Actinoplanes sp. NPDC026619 TaxID=3155798 RepID=UPI003411026D